MFWRPELNQINHALRSEVPTEPNDSRSEFSNWTKWIKLCALKSRLNQMICALRSEVPNWTKWIALCALKSRIEPNDSRSVLWSPELNQINHALCSEDPNLTKLMELCVLKTRTESNESRSAFWSPDWTKWFALWSPELNQMNHTLRSEVPTEPNDSRSALWSPELNQTIHALCALKSRTEPN